MSELVRLNLGAGKWPVAGFVNLDLEDGQPAYPLTQYADESVQEIRASHVLEHFSHHDIDTVLAEWVRVLVPGGSLRIAVPDFDWIVAQYQAREPIPLQGYIYGGHTTPFDQHGCLFTRRMLTHRLEDLGLEVDLQPWVSELADCASLPVSLNVQAWKVAAGASAEDLRDHIAGMRTDLRAFEQETLPPPAPIQIPAGAVKAIMAMPRLAFTENMFCALAVFAGLGIRLERRTGVFWEQALTNLIEPHLDDGTRYLLTLDYDTVFRTEDVLELVRLLETRPEIDAVCPWQSRRESESPLMNLGGGADRCGPREVRVPYADLAAEAMPTRTGHFGLTLLRVSAFADLERPWFASMPDDEGRWGDGRRDADIAFWHRWAQAGKTLYLANRVTVGHLQLVVSWPSADLSGTRHQYVQSYVEHGKPEGIWR